MSENLNLCEILKDCPTGTKLYSPFFGDCEFDCLRGDNVCVTTNSDYFFFYHDATLLIDNIRSREPMLFPSKDVRTWEGFKVKKPKFDPQSLQPFDKVLAFNSEDGWNCDIFSHIERESQTAIALVGMGFSRKVIPYNEETKHLVGTKDEAPDFYRYWEE